MSRQYEYRVSFLWTRGKWKTLAGKPQVVPKNQGNYCRFEDVVQASSAAQALFFCKQRVEKVYSCSPIYCVDASATQIDEAVKTPEQLTMFV